MPYIALERRPNLCVDVHPCTAGELTYVLSVVVDNYLADQADEDGEFSFRRISEVLGSLEATKLELYRRVIAPYEDYKREVNGEVFLGAPEDDDEELDLDALADQLRAVPSGSWTELWSEVADVPQAVYDTYDDLKACDCGCKGFVDNEGGWHDPEDDDSVDYRPGNHGITINVFTDGAGI